MTAPATVPRPQGRASKISTRPLRSATRVPDSPKGCVLYRGTSPFVPAGTDNAYAAVLTFQSDNRKTGDMAQIWFIAENESPLEARKLGLHQIVCGDCPVVKLCYVNLAHRPRTLYEAYKAGTYPDASPGLYEPLVASKGVRFGAYGDPVLMPIELVRRLAEIAAGAYTGYTHQWRRPEYQAYREFFMASVETDQDVDLALTMGWRYYRVTLEEPKYGEVLCPHQNERNKYAVLCNTCWACKGAHRPVGVQQPHSIIARPTGHNGIAARWKNHMQQGRSHDENSRQAPEARAT